VEGALDGVAGGVGGLGGELVGRLGADGWRGDRGFSPIGVVRRGVRGGGRVGGLCGGVASGVLVAGAAEGCGVGEGALCGEEWSRGGSDWGENR